MAAVGVRPRLRPLPVSRQEPEGGMTHADPKTEAAVIGALFDAGGPVLAIPAGQLLAGTGLCAADLTQPALRACLETVEALVTQQQATAALNVWRVACGSPAVEKLGYEKVAQLQRSNALDKSGIKQAAESLRQLRL